MLNFSFLLLLKVFWFLSQNWLILHIRKIKLLFILIQVASNVIKIITNILAKTINYKFFCFVLYQVDNEFTQINYISHMILLRTFFEA